MITDRDLTDALNPHDEDPYHDDDPIDDIAEKHDIDAKVSLSDGIHRIFAILKTAKLAVVVDDDGDIITLIGHQEAQKYAAMLDQDAAAAA